jgi:large subunit ribosomal protein L23
VHVVSPAKDVILRPLVTEKSLRQSERRNAYTFEVGMHANKVEIRRAVEDRFDVKVLDVRTQVRAGKPRRHGLRLRTTAATKRAIVTLKAGDSIELF